MFLPLIVLLIVGSGGGDGDDGVSEHFSSLYSGNFLKTNVRGHCVAYMRERS